MEEETCSTQFSTRSGPAEVTNAAKSTNHFSARSSRGSLTNYLARYILLSLPQRHGTAPTEDKVKFGIVLSSGCKPGLVASTQES